MVPSVLVASSMLVWLGLGLVFGVELFGDWRLRGVVSSIWEEVSFMKDSQEEVFWISLVF